MYYCARVIAQVLHEMLNEHKVLVPLLLEGCERIGPVVVHLRDATVSFENVRVLVVAGEPHLRHCEQPDSF
jgi:hypothetical protein